MVCSTTKYYGWMNLEITKGDSFKQTYTKQDSKGNAVDITGNAYAIGIKVKQLDASNLIDASATLSATPTDGKFTFNIPAATLFPTLDIGTYYYTIQETDSSSNVRTLIKGEFTVSWEGA